MKWRKTSGKFLMQMEHVNGQECGKMGISSEVRNLVPKMKKGKVLGLQTKHFGSERKEIRT
jgi:hypothetical protein